MNLSELRSNIGRTFKFVPLPRRDSATGSWVDDMNLWILQSEGQDRKGFLFLNAVRDHEPFVLDHSQIRKFDAPDKLILRGQVVLKDSAVLYEPFYQQPASSAPSRVSLWLSIVGADDNNILNVPHVDALPFEFILRNLSDHTVRDCKIVIYIPTHFKRQDTATRHGNLKQQLVTEIEGQSYTKYGDHITTPIYGNDSIPISELSLATVPGEHTIYWQIHCEDGVFPQKNKYGQIRIIVNSSVVPDDWLKP